MVVVVGLAAIVWAAGRGTPIEESTVTPPADVYDPVAAGEPLPSGFRQRLPRDAIRPIYNPRFVAPEAADWSDSTLVIGVSIEEQSRAYPVAFLNRREMVIDRIAGVPVLVTW